MSCSPNVAKGDWECILVRSSGQIVVDMGGSAVYILLAGKHMWFIDLGSGRGIASGTHKESENVL